MSTAVCFSSFPPVKASSGECPRESARCPVSGEYPVYTPGLRFFQKKSLVMQSRRLSPLLILQLSRLSFFIGRLSSSCPCNSRLFPALSVQIVHIQWSQSLLCLRQPCRGFRGHCSCRFLARSHTTGRPKGVCVMNRSVCQYVRALADEFHPGPGDIMLQYAVCSFDIFVE